MNEISNEHISFLTIFWQYISRNYIGTIMIGILSALGWFIWDNASLPANKREIQRVQASVNSLNSKDSSKTITLILMKDKLNSIENAQNEMKQDLKEGMRAIYNEIHRNK